MRFKKIMKTTYTVDVAQVGAMVLSINPEKKKSGKILSKI
jgi:hypothetical protein